MLLSSEDSKGATVTFNPKFVMYMREVDPIHKKDYTTIVQLTERETLFLNADYGELVKQWEEEVFNVNRQESTAR